MKIVQKFGGTSVGSIDRIRHCASLIEGSFLNKNQICVVTSAMAGQTSSLLNMTSSFKTAQNSPLQDGIVSTGEMITAGLLSLALADLGIRSKPLSGWQVPILTDNSWGNARILDILPQKINSLINQGIIPIVTGFQGMTLAQEVTTLGRGGSDTTASAIAAAIKAQRCDIYTDVDGVYSADPRLVPLAFKHDTLSFDTALEMASLGAKVLHPRCVEIAKRYDVPLRVLSSFKDGPGTLITKDTFMENKTISSITHTRDIIWVRFDQTTSLPLFLDLAFKHDIIIDMIQFNSHSFGCAIMENQWHKISHFFQTPLEIQTGLLRISLIGQGIRSHPDILGTTLKIMKSNPIIAIDMNDIRLSILTPCAQDEMLIQILHDELIINS